MRVLLDNNIPVRFGPLVGPDHTVVHVRDRGWQNLTNGELVKAADGEFDALVSVDKSMPHQTSLRDSRLMVVIIGAPSNRLADLTPLVPDLRRCLQRLRPGQFVMTP